MSSIVGMSGVSAAKEISVRGLRLTVPEETARVRSFLAEVFESGDDAHALDPRLLQWKYHDSRPDWNGSRSYVLERDGVYLSHGCVWPMPFVGEDGEIPACQIIDWAASSQGPGSGLLLRKRVEGVVPISIGIGGSPDTQRVMPLSGYKTLAAFRKFVRVIRPLQQYRQRRERPLWKRFARGGRAWLESFASLPLVPAEWSAIRVNRFDSGYSNREDCRFGFLVTSRSGCLLNYLLDCPGANVTGYLIARNSQVLGHFLLSEVQGQTRVADLQLRSGAPEDWAVAVAVVTRAAAELPNTCEVVASTSLDLFAEALISGGYRARGMQPVFVSDRQTRLSGRSLHITSADYDDFFSWYPASHFAA